LDEQIANHTATNTRLEATETLLSTLSAQYTEAEKALVITMTKTSAIAGNNDVSNFRNL
jgi:hypothetical protein